MTAIARARDPELLDRLERARVVGPVDARLHDDHAIHVQRAMQRAHLVDQGRLGRVDARRRHRKALRIAEDVGVAIARARRYVEFDRRARLRGSRQERDRRHLQKQFASRDHRLHLAMFRPPS